MSPAERARLSTIYREQEARCGSCPIEAGLIGSLADNECVHGRLRDDRTPACGCWEGEA